MKSEETLRKELIDLLQEQIENVKNNKRIEYVLTQSEIGVLSSVLELNIIK